MWLVDLYILVACLGHARHVDCRVASILSRWSLVVFGYIAVFVSTVWYNNVCVKYQLNQSFLCDTQFQVVSEASYLSW